MAGRSMKEALSHGDTMKTEWSFTGDINYLLLSLLGGLSFELKDENGYLRNVEPKMVQSEGMQLNIKPAHNEEVMMITLPVKITGPSFMRETMMSFRFDTGSVKEASQFVHTSKSYGTTIITFE
jgi:hypothetical protein